jgi:NOL1/NOP2/fmu family ribosome biogenesis protein
MPRDPSVFVHERFATFFFRAAFFAISGILPREAAIAEIKHEKLIPEHSLALSVELNSKNFSAIDLDLQDALRFLRKDTIEARNVNKGFALVRFNDLPLGWVNVLDSRINNLYPAQWRIRMQDRKE